MEITQGNENSITIVADENLHDYIQTDIDNGSLKITSNKNIRSAKEKKIKVVFKTF